jgi:hypothetical protein
MIRTIRLLAASAVILFSFLPAPCQADLITVLDEESIGSQQTYSSKVSATDLINVNQSTYSSVTVSGYTPYSGIEGPAAEIGSPDFILNDGAHGGDTGFSPRTYVGNAALDLDGTWTAIYRLNTTANTLGYDLKTIDTFTAHADNRAGQYFTVYVDMVSTTGDVWQSLGAFSSDGPNDGETEQAHHMQLASATGFNPAAFATGVDAIRFDVMLGSPYGDVWREIDVQGSATVPEPSTIVLTVLVLPGFGLVAWRRRRDAASQAAVC